MENFKFDEGSLNKLQKQTNFISNEYKIFLLSKDFLKDVTLSLLQNLDIIFYNKETVNKPVLKLAGPYEKISLIVFRIKQILSFSSLVSTNSVRMRKVAGNFKVLFEFGLRRAQGPSGAVTASKASYLTSFDGVSNVLVGFLTGSKLNGTCAHSFIMSYQGKSSPILNSLKNKEEFNFIDLLYNKCLSIRDKLKYNTNLSELSAFVAFSSIYRENSILLADTYNVFHSGLKNTIIIALAMNELGRKIKGVRLDSGNMVDQSIEGKKLFNEISHLNGVEWINELKVGASNDINEKTLEQFNAKNHKIDVFGIGTNLVTCQSDPYLKIKSFNLEKSENVGNYSNDQFYKIITNCSNFNLSNMNYSKNVTEIKKDFNLRYSLIEDLLN